MQARGSSFDLRQKGPKSGTGPVWCVTSITGPVPVSIRLLTKVKTVAVPVSFLRSEADVKRLPTPFRPM